MNVLPTVFPPPPSGAGAYRTLYVDFPWNETGGGRIKRGADKHYPLMKDKDILAVAPVIGAWAGRDAHCYLWVTNTYLEFAFPVLKAMGFRYVTTVTWVKDRMGLGQYYRGLTEHCLFAVRGRLPYRTREDGLRAQGRTAFYAEDDTPLDPPDLPSAIEAPRTVHSRKPEAMRAQIELVSPGPYLEVFARRRRPGWEAWGNDIAPESCKFCGNPSDDLPCVHCEPLLRMMVRAKRRGDFEPEVRP